MIRGLTLNRPWTWAITALDKRVENRSWRPPPYIVGRYIAIHAGKAWDEDGASWIEAMFGVVVPGRDELPSGVIVAVTRVLGLSLDGNDPWLEGPYGWQLADVVVLPTPVPCRGAQGLWVLPDDVLALVREGWKQAKERAA